jgi:hypothetical protein
MKKTPDLEGDNLPIELKAITVSPAHLEATSRDHGKLAHQGNQTYGTRRLNNFVTRGPV